MNKGSGNFIVAPSLAILLLACLNSCKPSAASSEVIGKNANQETAPGSQQPSTSQTASVSNVHEDEIPSLDEVGMVAHRKQYSNYEYAYGIEIPRELVGYSDPSPLPQHGMGIALSKEPKSYVWVDGSYNSFFFNSPDEAIDQDLEFLAKDGTGLEVLRREKAKLQKLAAIRSTVRYRSLATGENRVQDVIIALRPYDGGAGGITYTVGLISPESRYKDDVTILEQILNGWRVKPLPRP
jgi:hypothetical protein